MKNKKKDVKNGLWRLGYVFLLLLMGILVYAMGWSGIFSIKHISCQVNQESECSGELKAELEKYLNINLLTIRPSQIEKRIVAIERLAESSRVSLTLPGTLKVNVELRQAMAAITTDETVGEAIAVDENGVILGRIEDPIVLPRLVWSEISHWPIENPIPGNIVRAAEIAALASDRFQLNSVIRVQSQSNIVMTLKSGEKILLSLTKDPVEQLLGLQVVLNQARIEGKPITDIDLRFENPVVR